MLRNLEFRRSNIYPKSGPPNPTIDLHSQHLDKPEKNFIKSHSGSKLSSLKNAAIFSISRT